MNEWDLKDLLEIFGKNLMTEKSGFAGTGTTGTIEGELFFSRKTTNFCLFFLKRNEFIKI